MRRVAVVSPTTSFRHAAVELARTGTFEPDAASESPPAAIASMVRGHEDDVDGPRLAADPIEPEELLAAGRFDLLLGEASYEQHTAGAVDIGRCRVLPGWMQDDAVTAVRARLEPFGSSIVDLPRRPGIVPPTAHRASRAGDAFRPLVSTYAVVPYRDIDPTMFAAFAYMVMFGMMFGDVAHGLAILAIGLAALLGRSHRWSRIRSIGPFLVGAGLSATLFGLLYGEAFGPTGIVPTVWLRPLDEPERLLVAGLALGAVLLGATFVIATVDRWREGGLRTALYEPAGFAGGLLLLGLGALVGGSTTDARWATGAGWLLIGVGGVLVLVGLVAASGVSPAGIAQALIELFDTLLRLGSNVVSFARLAAFGLTHAVISAVVWDGSSSLWEGGSPISRAAAVVLFVAGNGAAFALGALVAAVQALRLEYYELFSRLFVSSGRPFEPWYVPVVPEEES